MIAAAIDIGTNSVKLTVGTQSADGSLTVLADSVQITRLGKGVDAAGELSPEAIARTLNALADLSAEARRFGATRIHAVGTSALRDAKNGAAFVSEAERVLGSTVEVITGDREAALVFTAAKEEAAFFSPDSDTVIATDIGGGSTEVIIGDQREIRFRESLQLGAVRLTERTIQFDPPTQTELTKAQEIAQYTASAIPSPSGKIAVIASGGTAANLAAMIFAQEHPGKLITADDLHGKILSPAQIAGCIKHLSALPLAERRLVPGLEPDRADVIIAGAIIQHTLLERFGSAFLFVSLRGLRYGLLYELLNLDS